MTVAATDNDAIVEKFAQVCAVEGNQTGINWTFSPVCDLDINYRNPITNVRTYGSDSDRVKKNTQIYVETLQNAGMAACAKHFPGDGVDYRDQHLHPTYNTLSAEEWYGSYGAIYENLIQHDLLSVMVGHIVQPAVAMDVNPHLSFENCLPASMSKEMLTGILRERYQFNGVITTDATIMGGYCMAMERRKAIPATIMAGCDMLVFNTNLAEDYGYILDGLRNGLLTEERLNEAVTRILALKAKVCSMKKDTDPIPADKWAKECADQAVTLVKNCIPDMLPVTKEKYSCIRLIFLGKDSILDGSVTEITKKILEEKGFPVEVYDPFSDELHGTGELDRKRLTLYIANYEQASNQTVVRINWCPKHALDTPRFVNEEDCIFVSLANPYLLQDVPRVKTYINAYTATENTIRAVIEKLLGESEFKGKSPVDPFCGLADTRL
jgi:beta-N-acetylhexosaminidase